MNSPQETNASNPRHPGVAQYEGSTGKDWHTGKKLSHAELASRAEADKLPQAETGRMELPALLLYVQNGEVIGMETAHYQAAIDEACGSIFQSPGVTLSVVPYRLVLRAQAMLDALVEATLTIEAARTDGPDWMLDAYEGAHARCEAEVNAAGAAHRLQYHGEVSPA